MKIYKKIKHLCSKSLHKCFIVVEATGLEPNPDTLNPFIYKAFSVYSPIVRQIFPLSKIIIFTANASSTSMKRRGGFEPIIGSRNPL